MENENIVLVSSMLGLTTKQVNAVLDLLSQGNTVPFIARYRKELTGGLDENVIRDIDKVYQYNVSLAKRKEDIIRLLTEKEMITEELIKEINNASKLTELEDIYRPFKEKRKTKATAAKAKGLEPLANKILELPHNDITDFAKTFINDEVSTLEEAFIGARDIIAEVISDSPKYRKYTSDMVFKSGVIITKVKKKHDDEKKVYEMYYEYSERIHSIVSHRILAINRAESQKVITVSIDIDTERFVEYIYRGVTRGKKSSVDEHITLAIRDGFSRLLFPSVERMIRSELTEKAEVQALKVFSINLEKLLLQAPLKDKMVLGLDPAFRTGCKLAVVDQTGKVLEINKVFITLPKENYDKDIKILIDLIKKYNVEIIAIGNGTASRESEAFIAKLIKDFTLDVDYAIISEAGASVYSASKIALEEFPDYQVEERSAVSIARRLQDPLAELVKIEPKAISVGQYQHDIAQKMLVEQLHFVVEKTVNSVGVDVNTASASLLEYVAGLTKSTAKNIILYRDDNGKFTSRSQIKKVSKLGAKTYEQAIGFLRIQDAKNPFDSTAIHPDNYTEAKALLAAIGMDTTYLGTKDIEDKINYIDKDKIRNDLGLDTYTFDDILDCFIKPSRSPRDNYTTPLLKKDILKIDDLAIGMRLEGTVRNVVDFGAFIDIGLKNDGLVHISKISNTRIKHPLEKLNIGDIVEVSILEVDLEKSRVGLTMLDL